MVIVEVRLLCGNTGYPSSDHFPLQLATGKIPFPNYTPHSVSILISKGKRPSKPTRFKAPGITLVVWKIAGKCWHQKAKERPEAKVILQCLEDLANPGECTHETCSFLPRELIDS